MYSKIRSKRQIKTHNYDSNEDDIGDVDEGVSAGWRTASILVGLRGPVVYFLWRYFPPPYSLGQIFEKGIF